MTLLIYQRTKKREASKARTSLTPWTVSFATSSKLLKKGLTVNITFLVLKEKKMHGNTRRRAEPAHWQGRELLSS